MQLTLDSDLRSNVESHLKVPQSTLTFTKVLLIPGSILQFEFNFSILILLVSCIWYKGSKENKLGSLQQESKVSIEASIQPLVVTGYRNMIFFNISKATCVSLIASLCRY